ncbi:MAG TPA: hypothetical protein VD906_15380, partial [Caulobacteraceae bacterium]|nr:hypothetical protein [Caulobacteraceae bacterium]
TRHGHPDLQGLWTNTALTFLARPPGVKNLVPTAAEAAMIEGGFRKMVGSLIDPVADPNAPAPPVVKNVENSDFLEMKMELARIRGEPRSSWIVEPADGQIPLTDVGRKAPRAFNRNTYEGPEARPLAERCLIGIGSPEGPPMMNTGFNGHYQIVQTKDHVAIHIEMNHDVRIVRLTDRSRPHEAVRPWMGDSVGWWEGDTLVVETTNFHPHQYVSSMTGGFSYSPKAKLVERFTRTAKDEILYEFTVEDPINFKSAWRGEMPFRPAKGPIYEYACHEGNYSLANALTGARAEERAAAEAKLAEAKKAP